MVIAQGPRLAVAGLASGAVAAFILTRLLTSFSHLLYGVGRGDRLRLPWFAGADWSGSVGLLYSGASGVARESYNGVELRIGSFCESSG